MKRVYTYILAMSSKVTFILWFGAIFSASNAQEFQEKSDYYNIVHSLQHLNENFFGAGVSFFDFDNDGWDDLSFIRSNNTPLFYKNMGGSFQLLPFPFIKIGDVKQLIWFDYDNDGDNDFAYSTYSNGSFKLFRNDGNFHFTDVTLLSGLHGLTTRAYGFSLADYDKDGDLDLYICRYLPQGDVNNPLDVNALFRNNGNGTFTNVTTFAGVGNGIATTFMGIWIDYNDDTWPDLYLINDRLPFPNAMYRNNGDGTFTDVTAQTNTAMMQLNSTTLADDPMSGTFADFDNDGDLDIYASNTGHPNTLARLLVNQNGTTFTEEAVQRGVALPQWGWGADFIDVDNDTWLDLYVATGTINPFNTSEVRSYLYMSNMAVDFTDSPHLFINHSNIAASYGIARGDINNDGFPDLVVANGKGFNSYLWENTGSSQNNYVKITLQGTISNKMAIGSWIKVYVGNSVFSHYTRCGENYCSQNSQHHIFGMAQYQTIDSIEVTYLSGIKDKYYNLATNQHYYFVEGETLSFSLAASNSSTICFGESVTIQAPDFQTYLWNTGETTQSIIVNQPGMYFLTAWNAQGHLYFSDTLDVSLQNPIVINYITEDVSCFGFNDGEIVLSVQSPTINYSVEWSNGGVGEFISNLTSGIYTYTYNNEFGCSISNEIYIFEPDEIELFTQVTPENSQELGTLNLFATGGEPPFSFFINGIASAPMSQLPSGNYEVEAVDASGCSVSVIVSIPYTDDSGLEFLNTAKITTFPNPLGAPFLLNVLLNSTQTSTPISGYDLTGRRVFEALVESSDGLMKLNLEGLHSGIYFFVLTIDAVEATIKVQIIE